MIPFPVSIESNCIADYFSTQTKLLSKKYRLLESAKLPKGKQKAIIGQVVNVPVDTAETVSALPRTANSSGFIPLKLKR